MSKDSSEGAKTPIMSPREFKYAMLRLAENGWEEFQVRRIAAAYIDADEKTKADLSQMLREDLAALGGAKDQPQ